MSGHGMIPGPVDKLLGLIGFVAHPISSVKERLAARKERRAREEDERRNTAPNKEGDK